MKRLNQKPVKFVILNEVKNLFPFKMVRFFACFRQAQNDRRKQSGITLVEMTVVVAVVAMLAVIAVPSVRILFNSMASESSTKAAIGAALASARAIAAKEQHYAGVRFQNVYDPNNPLMASQYMIFIIHDTMIKPSVPGNLACRAVKGVKPIKLPDSIGVMDMSAISQNSNIDTTDEFNNATTFSILFSPSGKLLAHTHKVEESSTTDDIFNTKSNIVNKGLGMFVEDKDSAIQPINELSRQMFYIYNRQEFERAYRRGTAYSEYLYKLASKAIHINAYTGGIISTD